MRTELEQKVIDLATLRGWTDPEVEYLKLVEEVGELAKAIGRKDTANIFEEAGDVLFVATNLHHLAGGHFGKIHPTVIGRFSMPQLVDSLKPNMGTSERSWIWAEMLNLLWLPENMPTDALQAAYEKNFKRYGIQTLDISIVIQLGFEEGDTYQRYKNHDKFKRETVREWEHNSGKFIYELGGKFYYPEGYKVGEIATVQELKEYIEKCEI